MNDIRKYMEAVEKLNEDCDETPMGGEDGECSPFTHADDNVDMVREVTGASDFVMQADRGDLVKIDGGEYDGQHGVVLDMQGDWDEGDSTMTYKMRLVPSGETVHVTIVDGRHNEVYLHQLEEDVFDEDYLVPPKDKYSDEEEMVYGDEGEGHSHDATDLGPDAVAYDDWDERDAPELDRQTNFDSPSRYDGDDSFDEDSDDPSAMECPACKEIAFVSKGVDGDLEEFECENCKHYGTFDAVKENGPGDDEFDYDDDAMVDVGDDEDYEVYDFNDEFEREMGNTMRYESVVEMNELRRLAGMEPIKEAEVVNEEFPTHGQQEWWKNDPEVLLNYVYWLRGQLPPENKDAAWEELKATLSKKNPPPKGVDPQLGDGPMGEMTEGEGDKCARCGKGTMHRGETFMGPAEECDHCNFQRQLDESVPYAEDDYTFFTFPDEKAYYLVADEIGDRVMFGMHNEVGVPEQYVDGIVALLSKHGFEEGEGYSFAGMEEDMQNGYNDRHMTDGDDYFPQGATSTPADELGPAGAKHGDNPMRTPMASVDKEDEVYESYKHQYRRFRIK